MAYLRNRGGEHDDLVKLAHPFHERIDAWSLDDIDIMVLTFDLDGDRKVGLMQDL